MSVKPEEAQHGVPTLRNSDGSRNLSISSTPASRTHHRRSDAPRWGPVSLWSAPVPPCAFRPIAQEDNRNAHAQFLSLIHISEPTRRTPISYAVFCLKKKKK